VSDDRGRRARRTPRTGHPCLDGVLAREGGVLAFAHRGGAFHPEIEGLENTLAAFRHAVELGYAHLETDVHLTRDGHLLAFHDTALDRVTDGTGEVSALTLAQVRRTLVGSREPVPLLAELLEAFPEAWFNVDLKSHGAAGALADLLREREAWDRVLVGSFSIRRLRDFRRRARGRTASAAHPLEVLAFLLVPSGRLLRLLTRGRVAALQVPERLPRGPWPLRLVTPGLVRRAHAAGAHVHVWTVDEPDRMERLLDLGVDGIMTDRTDLLRDVLLARAAWVGATREHDEGAGGPP
jgi:glycerophosphoryl diester phosphodiesterase